MENFKIIKKYDRFKLSRNIQVYLFSFLTIEEIIKLSKESKHFKVLLKRILKNSTILDSTNMKTNFFLFTIKNFYKDTGNLENIHIIDLNLNKKEDFLVLFNIIDFNKNSILSLMINNCCISYEKIKKLDENMSNYSMYNQENSSIGISQMFDHISFDFLELLDLSECHIGRGYIKIFNSLKGKKIKQLYLISCDMVFDNISKSDISEFIYMPYLEILDFSNNLMGGILSVIFKNPLKFPNIKSLKFNINRLKPWDLFLWSEENLKKFSFLKNFEGRKSYLDDENIMNYHSIGKKLDISVDFKDNWAGAKNYGYCPVHMLFSRSGIYETSCKNKNYIGKRIDEKSNNSILPLYIYPDKPKLEFSKSDLIQILKYENKNRLSDDFKREYEKIKFSKIEGHLELDREMIVKALIQSGYNPEKDDSLQAYHIATGKYINDCEVKNEVVWMKYDKCKRGNYSIGDKFYEGNIEIYDLNGNIHILNDMLLKHKRNFIVTGSLS